MNSHFICPMWPNSKLCDLEQREVYNIVSKQRGNIASRYYALWKEEQGYCSSNSSTASPQWCIFISFCLVTKPNVVTLKLVFTVIFIMISISLQHLAQCLKDCSFALSSLPIKLIAEFRHAELKNISIKTTYFCAFCIKTQRIIS